MTDFEDLQDCLEFSQHGNFDGCDDYDEDENDEGYNRFVENFIRWF